MPDLLSNPTRTATHAANVAAPNLGFSPSATLDVLGFRSGRSGGHLARSMMLRELGLIVAGTPAGASRDEIAAAILDANLLGKPTQASRRKSLSHLVQLYGLDPDLALFRVLRHLASLDPAALPLLALVCVYSRDPQLRASFGLVRTLRLGEVLERPRMESYLAGAFPERFSPAMLKSLAQNTGTSWTASGHLCGGVRKVRTHPTPGPIAVAYALLAGYLAGFRGQRLLNSEFGELACADPALIPSQLSLAAARGLVGFKRAGGVVELDFAPLLTPRERALLDDAH